VEKRLPEGQLAVKIACWFDRLQQLCDDDDDDDYYCYYYYY